MVRFPHTFVVSKPTNPDTIPPDSSGTVILLGSCDVQPPPSGGEKNKNEAMKYDYIVFHKETITEDIKANYSITCNVLGKTITGTISKSFPGQLTNRIWFDEISK